MPRQENFPLTQPTFAEPVFNEDGNPTPDPTGFMTPHLSDDAVYKKIQELLTKDVVVFDPMRGQPQDLYTLASAYGARGDQVVQQVQAQGQICFQVIGDSGVSNAKKYSTELNVFDKITQDTQTANAATRPVFLYHVGDVVYDFGESEYYYDQYYEPMRNYPAPVFAIPGNHDSFIVPGTAAAQDPLTIFTRNFCATSPVVTSDARSLHRTAGMQPGVYFSLDAPFLRIIGLFSNALESPGVISSETVNGTQKWPIPDLQLDYLRAQLQSVVDDNYTGALLIAVHHPPFDYTGGNPVMLLDIDTICSEMKVYPHAILSGHVHNYQRYLRTFTFNGKQIDVPFVDCGNGGHNVQSMDPSKTGSSMPTPGFGTDMSSHDVSSIFQGKTLTLQEYDQTAYGYLTVTANATQLTIAYNQVTGAPTEGQFTPITIDLATHTVVGP